MPAVVGSLGQLWMGLLLFCSAGRLAAIKKSIITLNPQWNPIFVKESVTLICNGNTSFQANSTTWFHNDIMLPQKTSSLEIVNANISNSGEYKCQDQKHTQSNPVVLEVLPTKWLLLQVSAKVVKVGEPLFLRCHSWKNEDAFKVIYYKNGKALKYWYENFNLSFNKTTLEDSGLYNCTGIILGHNQSSQSLYITVKAPKIKWIQFIIPLLVGILFVVDTGLFILTKKQFQSLLKMQKIRKDNIPINPKPKPDPKEK
ncbi:PREDICTED: high affinity immunoglobulin epsilon receptor subunit alpha [Elephantulus edwardii]|uniref:high affinity immunoglobulin epsilon receptor subunit alpha n=1 Tax=Elephantulus edwardii TaxID=28737 RepID=UPI0003F0DB08|nr:PREDICTED: high affinity immunoglobulin epsilon receptor subunit alpha [Elephantulus edwardii]